MEGVRIIISKMHIPPKMMLAPVVTKKLVLMTFPLSSRGRKRMMEESKPRVEKRATSARDDMSAVARPTCSRA